MCLVCPQDKGQHSNVHIDNLWLNPLSFRAQCFPSLRGGWWLLFQRDTLPGRCLREGRGEQPLYLDCPVPWLPFVTGIFHLWALNLSLVFIYFSRRSKGKPLRFMSVSKGNPERQKNQSRKQNTHKKGKAFQRHGWEGKVRHGRTSYSDTRGGAWARRNWARRRAHLYTGVRGDVMCYFMWFGKKHLAKPNVLCKDFITLPNGFGAKWLYQVAHLGSSPHSQAPRPRVQTLRTTEVVKSQRSLVWKARINPYKALHLLRYL